MKFTYGEQTIDLFGEEDFPEGPPSKILLGLSGGLDSSSLLYLICTNFPDMEVVPYAGNDHHHPMDYLNAINVNQWFMERFSQVHKTIIFDFNALDQPYWDQAIELIESGKKEGFASVRGVSKTLVMNEKIDEIRATLPGVIRLSGMTSNPPDDVMQAGDFYDIAERRRDKGVIRNTLNGDKSVYEPLTNVDKKFVAGVYQEHGLMDELFYLTGSCVGSVERQGYGMHGCGECFWCNEKQWSFGEY